MNTRNYVTVIVNSSIEFAMHNKVLANIPLLSEMAQINDEKLSINTPMPVDYRHLALIVKIIKGEHALPTIDLPSHADVLTCIRLAEFLKIDAETFQAGFVGWCDHHRWIELWHPEYLYLIYKTHPELVDFNKFFRNHKKAVESIATATSLQEIRRDATLFIEMLLFFKQFNFALCFDKNDAKTQERINSLKLDRAKIWETFMVNPYEFRDYFKYIPIGDDIWDRKGISVAPELEFGTEVLADESDVRARLREFTLGKLEKPDKQFPFDNVVIAGGSMTRILSRDYNPKKSLQSDVDLFIYGATYEERSRVFNEVVQWFHEPGVTFYGIRGSVASIYMKNVARKFQIVSMKATTPYDVIGHFDTTHIQWCFWKDKFYGTPEACRSMREKTTRFNNTQRLKTNRMIKALYCGYNILKSDEIINNHIDLTQLLKEPNSPSMQKLIRDLHGWYYPVSNPNMDEEDERQHILCQIEQDSKSTLVTDDPQFVIKNITIGGNFEDNYESTLFTTFNAGTVQFNGQGRRVEKATLRTKHGVIKLTTGILRVNKVVSTDNGLEIFARSDDPAFRDFCNTLEGNVYRMFRQGGVTRHLLDDNNVLKIVVSKYKLDSQTNRRISCMRSQKGAPLIIEEDLRAGDDIQVLFVVDMITREEDRAVEIKPLRFVKFVPHDVEVSEEPEDHFVETTGDFNGEITYDETI